MSLETLLAVCADGLTDTATVAEHLQHIPSELNVPCRVTDTLILADESPGLAWTRSGQYYYVTITPNLPCAAISCGGLRRLDNGSFQLSADDAERAAKLLSVKLAIPKKLRHRNVLLSTKIGYYEAAIPTEDGDDKPLGWTLVNRHWRRALGHALLVVPPDEHRIRCLEKNGEAAGFSIQKDDGGMFFVNSGVAKMFLQNQGETKTDAERILGWHAANPWVLVSLPFQPEYPGDRRWNRGAPQLRYQPIPGEHPHWDMIFDHIGADLDPYIPALDWAQQSNIKTGADYLRAIFAAIIREPFEPTPYLFLFGEEDNGKSTLHEAFELLVTSGVVKADRSLTSQSDFNGELAGAILCVVEEKDISKTPGALAKIKEAVTARKLSIRRMRTDSYMLDNSTHWIQCSNHITAAPKFPGDSRIQPIHVGPLENLIPKKFLFAKLIEEAPAMTHTLLNMRLPEYIGRLRIPLVRTAFSDGLEDRFTDAVVARLASVIEDKWTGTASALSAAVDKDVPLGERRVPTDFRKLVQWLDSCGADLKACSLTWEALPASGKNPRKLTITKAA